MKGNLFLFIWTSPFPLRRLHELLFLLCLLLFEFLYSAEAKKELNKFKSSLILKWNAKNKNKQTSHFLYNLANVLLFVEQDEEIYLKLKLSLSNFSCELFDLGFFPLIFKCWTIFLTSLNNSWMVSRKKVKKLRFWISISWHCQPY